MIVTPSDTGTESLTVNAGTDAGGHLRRRARFSILLEEASTGGGN